MFLLRYALASALLVPLHTLAQQPATAPPGGLVIRLEQLRNDKVIPVRPEHVFGTDDVLRFRLKSATDGFVYVVDHATSGDYTVLFPANDLAGNHAVRGETEFYVPSPEEGWFQVGGAAGFDTIYFLLSPRKLAVSSTQTRSKQEKLPDNLLPRCNDTIFQARGECVDSSAGPAVLPRGASLPPQISTAAANASRDLVMVNEADGNVKVTKTNDGPAVYIFRIAHK